MYTAALWYTEEWYYTVLLYAYSVVGMCACRCTWLCLFVYLINYIFMFATHAQCLIVMHIDGYHCILKISAACFALEEIAVRTLCKCPLLLV